MLRLIFRLQRCCDDNVYFAANKSFHSTTNRKLMSATVVVSFESGGRFQPEKDFSLRSKYQQNCRLVISNAVRDLYLTEPLPPRLAP